MFKVWGNYAGWKVLAIFLKSPTTPFYVRQAAKEAGVGTLAASTYMEAYAKTGLLSKRKRGNLLEFKLNDDDEYAKALKRAYALYLAKESRIVEKIREEAPFTTTICLYGSYANGSYDEKSDFDLLVVSPKEKGFQGKLANGREASILCVSLEGWRKLNPDFKASVVKSHVLLYGNPLVEV